MKKSILLYADKEPIYIWLLLYFYRFLYGNIMRLAISKELKVLTFENVCSTICLKIIYEIIINETQILLRSGLE